MDKSSSSLSARIIKIVVLSMAAILVFLFFCITVVLRENEHRKKEYIAQTAVSIASSLNATGQNIAGMGRYISNFDAFQKLYIKNLRQAEDTAGNVVSAFHAVRFMADNFQLVEDVIVVSTSGIRFSYLSGKNQDVLDTVAAEYDFNNPFAILHKFVYFDNRDFFAYIVPISDTYTTTIMREKSASCVVLCSKKYIGDLIDQSLVNGMVQYSVFDAAGNMVLSNKEGWTPSHTDTSVIAVQAEAMGLTIWAKPVSLGIENSYRLLLYFGVFAILLLVLVMAAVIVMMQRQVATPIEKLVTEMSHWGGTSLRKRLPRSNIQEIDLLISGFNMMLDEIEAYTRKIFSTQEKLYEMELRKNETERYALQSQVNPHFLFNTLQCIRSIALVEGVGSIAEISLSMSELFRYSMHYKPLVAIRQEIEILQHYIRITEIRFGDRFCFETDFKQEIMKYSIGPMMLQPLVENAVMHGVGKLPQGGVIKISGKLHQGDVWLSVWDNGPGIRPEKLEDITRKLSKGFAETIRSEKSHSFGLYNINRRLKLQFGESGGLLLLHENGGTTVSLHFPAKEF